MTAPGEERTAGETRPQVAPPSIKGSPLSDKTSHDLTRPPHCSAAVRTTSTEQCARTATAADTLPSRNRLTWPSPLEPTKTQSAPHRAISSSRARWGCPSLRTEDPVSPEVVFENLDPQKRPLTATADFKEIVDVVSVTVREDRSTTVTLLFDPDHSLEERIAAEQFAF
jgi:hypothetical protein